VFAPLFEEAPIAPEVTESIIDNPDINKEPEEGDHVDAFGAELWINWKVTNKYYENLSNLRELKTLKMYNIIT